MKVLQIITSLKTGGAEKLLVDSVPIYQRKGIDTDVLILLETNSAFKQILKKTSNGKIYTLTKNSIYNPLLVFKIIPYIKRYDIIHVHLFPALYWVGIAKMISLTKKPLIYTEHSTNNKRRERKIFRFIERIIYAQFEYISSISEETQMNLQKWLYGGAKQDTHKPQFKIIQNGIDLNVFQQRKKDVATQDTKTIMMVSRFSEQKDHTTVVKAFNKLNPKENKLRLVFIGDGKLKSNITELVYKLNIQNEVIFLGNRYDIPDLITQAYVGVQSSHWEGFGLTAVEFMASGVPVVGSKVEGLESVIKGGGLTFEKGNYDQLAKILSDIISDKSLRERLIISGLRRAQDFSIEKTVDSYINLYKELDE